MKKQDNIGTDHFQSRSSEEELHAAASVDVGVTGNLQVPATLAPPAVTFRRLVRLAGRIATYSAGLFLVALVMSAAPAPSSAQVAIGISVTYPPPALPVYIQPLCPGPGYIWIPGYWAWDPVIGYYWVPGTWMLAPFPGALWTPGYWGWNDGVYVWYEGYWGPVVGFYGGIYYGFGYTGYGYEGGYWRHGVFYYNRSVNNVSVTNIRNFYSKPVVRNVAATRVSYNGGRGGATLRPTAAQMSAGRQRSSPPTGVQREQEQAARAHTRQRAAVNHGRPAVAATPKPGMLTGRGVIRASRAGAPYKPPPSRAVAPGAHPRTPHPAGIERRPTVPAPEHAAPSAVRRSETVRPAHPHPGMTPPHMEPRRAPPHSGEPRPHAAPRAVPERRGVERPPSSPHFAPERPSIAHPTGTPHAAPQRQGAPHPQRSGGDKREERRPH